MCIGPFTTTSIHYFFLFHFLEDTGAHTENDACVRSYFFSSTTHTRVFTATWHQTHQRIGARFGGGNEKDIADRNMIFLLFFHIDNSASEMESEKVRGRVWWVKRKKCATPPPPPSSPLPMPSLPPTDIHTYNHASLYTYVFAGNAYTKHTYRRRSQHAP